MKKPSILIAGDVIGAAPAESRERVVSAEEFGIAEYGTPTIAARPLRFNLRFDPRTAIPLLGRGDCLKPWFCEGDIQWYNPGAPLHENDLVVCELTYRRLSSDTGERVHLTAIKQLRTFGWDRYLVCNQGAVLAREATILGPVTAWRRRAWWRRPSLRSMRFELPAVK